MNFENTFNQKQESTSELSSKERLDRYINVTGTLEQENMDITRTAQMCKNAADQVRLLIEIADIKGKELPFNKKEFEKKLIEIQNDLESMVSKIEPDMTHDTDEINQMRYLAGAEHLHDSFDPELVEKFNKRLEK